MAKRRVVWVDVLKGIGILLVIFSHALTAFSRRSGDVSFLNYSGVKAIDGFFMPLFFFASGFFISHTLMRSFWVVFKTKFSRLMVPYFVWGIISVLFFSFYERSFEWLRIVELPFRPIFVLWFVYALFLCSMVYYLLKKSIKSDFILLLIAFAIYTFGHYMTRGVAVADDSTLKLFIGSSNGFIFLVLGDVLSRRFELTSMNNSYFESKWFYKVIASVICVFTLSALEVVDTKNNQFGALIVAFLVAVFGIILVVTVSMLIEKISFITPMLTATIARFGKDSMSLYLSHKIVLEIVSVAVSVLPLDGALSVGISIVVTIALCYAINYIVVKASMAQVFFGDVTQ